MRIIEPKVTIEQWPSTRQALLLIEKFTRLAYKSEEKGGTLASAEKVIRSVLSKKPYPHESTIEHVSASVRFVVDRGITHELVRHRLCAFTQESTRYCNYALDKFGKELSYINPNFWNDGEPVSLRQWERLKRVMSVVEEDYMAMLADGAAPQEARSILPNCIKSEIIMTANFRQWRHVFSLRCHKTAHPQMRQVMKPLLAEFVRRHPVFFDNIPDIQDLLPVYDKPELEIVEDLIAA